MMYPRLALLKRFLRLDGSIWISMDDSEVALLRVLMDEVFGRERFIACNVWQKRYSRENREAIGDVHEYPLVYAMDPERFKATRNRLAQYFGVFAGGMWKRWAGLNYIEICSGPGRCVSRETGEEVDLVPDSSSGTQCEARSSPHHACTDLEWAQSA